MQKISSDVVIGENIKLGFNVIIEENVKIGSNVCVGHNVIIKAGTVINNNVNISDNSIIGKLPLKAKNSAVTEEKKYDSLIIGNGVTIGAGCIVYYGSFLGDDVFLGDYATIREEVKIDKFTIIGKGVSVENKTVIGKYVKIETEAYITAMSKIEDYCFIAPEVVFTNDNFLGRTEERKKYFKGPVIKKGARIGANVTILPGVIVAEDSLIAAGSILTKNTISNSVYVGSPAKRVRDVKENELLVNQKYYKK